MTDYVPENSDEHHPPDTLQTETLTCDHCDEEFGAHGDLIAHEAACEAAESDEGN